MKRTRRIEVIRYTRRVTVSAGGNAPPHADEWPAIDLPPAVLEGEGGPAPEAVAADPQASWPRSASRLRDLLRLGRPRPGTSGK